MAKLNDSVEVKNLVELTDELKLVSDGQNALEGIASNWFGDMVANIVSNSIADKEELDQYTGKFESIYADKAGLVTVEYGGYTYAARDGNITVNSVTYSVPDNKRTVEIEGNKVKVKKEPMPSAYRSAKSVIGKAMAAGIELVDSEGYPKGKTALEKEIKEQQPDKSELEKFYIAIDTASKIAAKLEDEEAINEAVRRVNTLLDSLCGAVSDAA